MRRKRAKYEDGVMIRNDGQRFPVSYTPFVSNSKYTGDRLRKIRAKNGVGNPPPRDIER